MKAVVVTHINAGALQNPGLVSQAPNFIKEDWSIVLLNVKEVPACCNGPASIAEAQKSARGLSVNPVPAILADSAPSSTEAHLNIALPRSRATNQSDVPIWATAVNSYNIIYMTWLIST